MTAVHRAGRLPARPIDVNFIYCIMDFKVQELTGYGMVWYNTTIVDRTAVDGLFDETTRDQIWLPRDLQEPFGILDDGGYMESKKVVILAPGDTTLEDHGCFCAKSYQGCAAIM
eukprot:scaffold2259_cov180-Amphora_coffeaeformis.AAC.9